MSVYSFHLASSPVGLTARMLLLPPTAEDTPGLRKAECMAAMRLGSPIVSPDRMQLRRLAVFAWWDDAAALDRFLATDGLGRTLSDGWHVRMALIRRWGHVPDFDERPDEEEVGPETPVVAVTLARLKLPQVARFIYWGKPVEEQVRDHPGTTLALAAMRPPRTVSTFSVWRSLREMREMVRGHGAAPHARRHADAMVERERKGFHHAFTTLRFRPLSEHGEWEGRGGIVPGLAAT
jgi:hypothetical protein